MSKSETLSKFKVGDRVAVYGWTYSTLVKGPLKGERGIILTIESEHSTFSNCFKVRLDKREETVSGNWEDTFYFLPEQCRRLAKKPRRRIWLYEDDVPGPSSSKIDVLIHGHNSSNQDNQDLVEFVEVRRKK